MKHDHFSAFLLLVLSMMFVLACDDETTVEQRTIIPQSDFEWTTTWQDAGPTDDPIFDGNDIIIPTFGAFDLVKVDSNGAELWRQSYDERLHCTGSLMGQRFLGAGFCPVHDEYVLDCFALTGERYRSIVIDPTVFPSALVTPPFGSYSYLIGEWANADGHLRVASATVSSQNETPEYVYLDAAGNHDEQIDGALATSTGNAIVFGIRYTDVETEVTEPQIFFYKLAYDGSPEWISTFSFTGEDGIEDIAELPDGDLIAVGCANCYGVGIRSLVLRISPDGELVWQRQWEIGSESYAKGVVTIGDSIIISGIGSTSDGVSLLYLSAFNPDGNLMASITLSNNAELGGISSFSADGRGGLFICQRASISGHFSLSKLRQPIFPDAP